MNILTYIYLHSLTYLRMYLHSDTYNEYTYTQTHIMNILTNIPTLTHFLTNVLTFKTHRMNVLTLRHI